MKIILITLFALFSLSTIAPAVAEEDYEESGHDYYNRLIKESAARNGYDDDEPSISDRYGNYDDPFKKSDWKSSPYYERPTPREDRVKTIAPKGGQQLDTWGRGTRQWSSEQVLQRQLESAR